jgi:hypothetical protein
VLLELNYEKTVFLKEPEKSRVVWFGLLAFSKAKAP